jgi:hypothetical protein
MTQTMHDSLEALNARINVLIEELEALREWRARVTVALDRPGGAAFADVAQHIRQLVAEHRAYQSALRDILVLAGQPPGSEEV